MNGNFISLLIVSQHRYRVSHPRHDVNKISWFGVDKVVENANHCPNWLYEKPRVKLRPPHGRKPISHVKKWSKLRIQIPVTNPKSVFGVAPLQRRFKSSLIFTEIQNKTKPLKTALGSSLKFLALAPILSETIPTIPLLMDSNLCRHSIRERHLCSAIILAIRKCVWSTKRLNSCFFAWKPLHRSYYKRLKR